MKTFVGCGNKLNPDMNITREEAFLVLARSFKLSGAAESALDKFSDKALVRPMGKRWSCFPCGSRICYRLKWQNKSKTGHNKSRVRSNI